MIRLDVNCVQFEVNKQNLRHGWKQIKHFPCNNVLFLQESNIVHSFTFS